MPVAKKILASSYPFAPMAASSRSYSETQMLRVFLRDGFVDRYSGCRLIFPGTLRLISKLMPIEFPFQKNWKMSQTHIAYWELCPTIDHLIPITRGGSDDESNWITTSMLRNSAKSNWTLEELGWQLFPPGDLNAWDGLIDFFMSFVEEESSVLTDKYMLRWNSAAKLLREHSNQNTGSRVGS